MSIHRREFIKQVGIALASAVMAGCTESGGAGQPSPTSTLLLTSSSTPTPTLGCVPFEAKGDSPRERIRSCWMALDWLAQQSQKGLECGGQACGELEASHRAALDDLIAAEKVDAAVAEQAQLAFGEAVSHVWRLHGAISCYVQELPLSLYIRTSRDQLIQKATLLARMADRADLDPDTVAQAQAVIERDIAFLGPSQGGWTEPAGRAADYPDFDELDLEISPEAAQAARVLVELLLQE